MSTENVTTLHDVMKALRNFATSAYHNGQKNLEGPDAEMDEQIARMVSVITSFGLKANRAFADVIEELTRAKLKHPLFPIDLIHATSVMAEESGETVKAALQATYEPDKSTIADVRAEAVQTAAMAIRLINAIDRGEVEASRSNRIGQRKDEGHE